MKYTFRFQGGFLDGHSISGDANDVSSPAHRYVFLTDRGRLGKRFREMPPERIEQIRRLLIPKHVEDASKAAWQLAMEDVDWQDPPNDEELRARYESALQELGVDMASHQPSDMDAERIFGQLRDYTRFSRSWLAMINQTNHWYTFSL